MQTWTLNAQVLRNPPTDRIRAVHMLHHTVGQSVPMLDENSALRGNMPQCNDEEGGKKPRLSFSPAVSVWGQMGRAWTTGAMLLALQSQSRTRTMLPSSISSSGSSTTLPSLPLRMCHAATRGTSWVVTVPGTTSTPASSMLRTGPERTTMSCGRWRAFVRQPVSPPITSRCSRVRATAASISKSATSAWRSRPTCWWTIRNYRDTYRRNRHVAFLPACMSTSGRIHGEHLHLIFFLSNKKADDYVATLGFQPHQQEFCHRRGVFFQQNRGAIGMACA
jgi:hypothetical protein